jgi:hypothetical protein
MTMQRANRRTGLWRVEPGLYRLGDHTLRGIRQRMDGRDGSRINRWLVYDVNGAIVGEHATLARAVEELLKR